MSTFDIQFASNAKNIPSKKEIEKWIKSTLNKKETTGTLSIRIVDEAEMTDLNTRYRHKAKPTNVLSFPCPVPFKHSGSLGDIVICAPIIEQEAIAQKKPLMAHWAHMVVHGILHLLGHDHEEEAQAALMEGIEIDILESLGFNNPYRETANA